MVSYLGSKRLVFGVVFIVSTWCIPQTTIAQVVLYVEVMTDDKPIKYYEGQVLMYKSKDYPKEWQQIKIERLIDEEKIILFDGGMLNLADVIEIRRNRTWATAAGYMLQTFGVAWYAFGGIAHLTTDSFDFGVDTFIIGGTAIVSGWLIKKLFRHKKYKIGKKVRLKILDLSWPEPRG